MAKPNFVLVHSFPTNSILLAGLIEYLNDFFNVHFVDLPGFTKAIPPVRQISLQAYSQFLEGKLNELALEQYLIGGISFGFAVVNGAALGDACRGILAVEPYMGRQSLRMKPWKRVAYSLLIQSVCALKLSYVLWKSSLLRRFMLAQYPAWTVDVLLEQVDARTFFETANILINDRSTYAFHDLPYVLIANKDDTTVNYAYLHSLLSSQVKRLLVLNTTIAHYPDDLSKAYFQRAIPGQMLDQVLAFTSVATS